MESQKIESNIGIDIFEIAHLQTIKPVIFKNLWNKREVYWPFDFHFAVSKKAASKKSGL